MHVPGIAWRQRNLTLNCFIICIYVRERQGKTWMEGVQAAMTTRNLEPDQWRNREEWRLVSRRRRQLL